MSYRSIEQVFSRKHERVAAMFSVHNVLGVVALALPIYMACRILPGWLHMSLTVLAAAAGYVLTLDRDGMAIYERIIWRLRAYAAPILTGKRVLSPSQLPGMHVQAAPRVMVHGGAVRITRGRSSGPKGALAPAANGTQTVRKVSRPIRPAAPRPVSPQKPTSITEPDALPDGELVALPETRIAPVGAEPILVGVEER